MSQKHKLKAWPEPFWSVVQGRKRHEFRKNDRDFRVGDTLALHEWDPNTERYSGHVVKLYVTYASYGPDFGIPEGYVVMSVRRI